VESNIRQRALEAGKAEEIVNEEIGQFFSWLSALEVTPAIIALRSRCEEIRKAELARTIAAWKDIRPEDEKRLEALTGAIIGKLLHNPINVLKQNRQGNRNDLYVDALRQLFDLKTETPVTEEKMGLEE
jgi:glutamyl-tRNA reductase